MEKSPIFDKIYRDYLSQVWALNLDGRAERLGIRIEPREITVPLFQQIYRITPDGIEDENGRQPLHAVSVLLCRYVILCPAKEPCDGEEWVTYKDFKDATPFVSGFVNHTEKAIAHHFAGRVSDLEMACASLGGVPFVGGPAYDLSVKVFSLPKIPLCLFFNDTDEEFPAECRVLFERRAAQYLDMECLAIAGWLLTDSLMHAIGKTHSTIM